MCFGFIRWNRDEETVCACFSTICFGARCCGLRQKERRRYQRQRRHGLSFASFDGKSKNPSHKNAMNGYVSDSLYLMCACVHVLLCSFCHTLDSRIPVSASLPAWTECNPKWTHRFHFDCCDTTPMLSSSKTYIWTQTHQNWSTIIVKAFITGKVMGSLSHSLAVVTKMLSTCALYVILCVGIVSI